MGTRASILIKNRDCKSVVYYRQFDGYPSGAGEDLGKALDATKGEHPSIDSFVRIITSAKYDLECVDGLQLWSDYIYIVDLYDRCVMGYSTYDIKEYFNCERDDLWNVPIDAMPRTKMCWFYHSSAEEDERDLVSHRCTDVHRQVTELSRTCDPMGELARIVQLFGMHMEFSYSRCTDFMIEVYRRGCGENGEDLRVTLVQHCDFAYVCYKALADTMKYCTDNLGGY